MSVWLPPEKEKINPTDNEKDIMNKVLFTLNKSLNAVDNIEVSVKSLASNTTKLGASANNITFEPIRNIQESDTQSSIIIVLQELIETPQLETKDQYVNIITNYRSSITINQYMEINNITEQLYSYKETFNSLNIETSINKTRVQATDNYIKDSIKTSEDKLNQAKSIPGIASKIPKNLDTKLATLKNEASGKTNLMNELENILDKNIRDLADMQFNLIARLNNQSVQPAEEISQAQELSQDQLKNLATRLTELPAPKQLNLNRELQKAIQHFQNDELDKASEILQNEISKDPQNWRARKYMAQIYIANKDYDKAIEEINKALESFKKKTKLE